MEYRNINKAVPEETDETINWLEILDIGSQEFFEHVMRTNELKHMLTTAKFDGERTGGRDEKST